MSFKSGFEIRENFEDGRATYKWDGTNVVGFPTAYWSSI